MGKYKYFMVCTTGRSGSTYLCDLLRNTKVAGMSANRRSHKNANRHFEKLFINRSPIRSLDWNKEDLSRVIEKLFRETASDNGVCSFKIMGPHLEKIVQHLNRYSRYENLNIQNIAEYFPDGMKAVFLTRRSKLRQAISRVRARGKTTWHLLEGQERVPDMVTNFDSSIIARFLLRVKSDEKTMKTFLIESRIPYMQVEYESLVEDKDAVIKSIFRFLGIPYPKGHVLESGLVRQSDELTEKLVEKFSSPKMRFHVWLLMHTKFPLYEFSHSLKIKSGTYKRFVEYIKG